MFNTKKYAFTLAETMVVMLAVSIIFAAFAPIITKRRLDSGSGKYSVWAFSDRDAYDAYSTGSGTDVTQEMFIGVTPVSTDSITTSYAPLSKLIIRSGLILDNNFQRQIQFRYGRTSTTGAGDFAGTWFMGDKNALLGGTSYSSAFTGKYNTSVGYGALGKIRTGNNNTALGYKALSIVSIGKNNVGVGSLAGASTTSRDGNVFVGYKAGTSYTGAKNVFVGHSSASNSSGSGSSNTFVGAYTGNKLTTGSENVAIGYGALQNLTTGTNNVAVGAGALANLQSGSNNVAIGYNACRFVTGSNKTCIGAYSGPKNAGTDEGQKHQNSTYLTSIAKNNLAAGTTYLGYSDDVQRTYIGSSPNENSGFGGDAVLEIHNPSLSSTYTGLTLMGSAVTSNTTTVINGNLIVRGRPYFTVGSNLYHFADVLPENSTQYIYGLSTTSKYYKVCAANQYTYNFGSCDVSLTTSDRRLKDIGSKNTAGLNEINQLKVYNYTFKKDKENSLHVGVIAQQLQKVFPNSVFKGEDGFLRIRWDEIFYALINSVKELDDNIIAMIKRTTNIDSQISKMEAENEDLKAQITDLTLRVEKLKKNK